MNCREFLEEFYGRTILAFAQRETTFAFKFKAENIATFMKK
ncbi:MAG: hypothetical protein QG635_421, partial [Bacteroidota bacterium]|nr:hypothetical protein [Bacteroidota bacterium]